MLCPSIAALPCNSTTLTGVHAATMRGDKTTASVIVSRHLQLVCESLIGLECRALPKGEFFYAYVPPDTGFFAADRRFRVLSIFDGRKACPRIQHRQYRQEHRSLRRFL